MPLIEVNGLSLFYDLTGPAEAPVVAFSNSLGTTLEMWDFQVRALASRYRCLRYDTRGHGRTGAPDEVITIDTLADDLAGLLDALGIPQAHVVGLSLGGMTAQTFALRHPERTTSLVLMATSAHLPPPELWDQRVATVRAQGMGPLVDGIIPRWFTPPSIAAFPERVKQVRERFLGVDPVGYAVCCGAIRDMDLRERIGAIAKPTLILAGADDPATPVAMMIDIQTRIAGAELVVIPGAAHLLAVEQPEAVNAHLEAFLSRVGA